MKTFPNGVESYLETHFELSGMITLEYSKDNPTGVVKEAYDRQGTGAMYELAEEWTDTFERMNEGRAWDGEFFDEIEEFFEMKNKL